MLSKKSTSINVGQASYAPARSFSLLVIRIIFIRIAQQFLHYFSLRIFLQVACLELVCLVRATFSLE